MPGNKKPRKSYNPKVKALQAGGQAPTKLEKLHASKLPPLTLDQRMKLMGQPHQALLSLRGEAGSEQDWITLTCRLAVGGEIAHLEYSENVQAELLKAIETCIALRVRVKIKKELTQWHFTTEEANQIHECLSSIDEMQDTMEAEHKRHTLIFAQKKANELMRKFF